MGQKRKCIRGTATTNVNNCFKRLAPKNLDRSNGKERRKGGQHREAMELGVNMVSLWDMKAARPAWAEQRKWLKNWWAHSWAK